MANTSLNQRSSYSSLRDSFDMTSHSPPMPSSLAQLRAIVDDTFLRPISSTEPTADQRNNTDVAHEHSCYSHGADDIEQIPDANTIVRFRTPKRKESSQDIDLNSRECPEHQTKDSNLESDGGTPRKAAISDSTATPTPTRSSGRFATKKSYRPEVSGHLPPLMKGTPVREKPISVKSAAAIAANSFAIKVISSRSIYIASHYRVFLPLLPEKNSLANMISRQRNGWAAVPTPKIRSSATLLQPKGVQDATMKPYQLEGLSFLAWMHVNGMPAILGDEMGLGKTLTTLALMQSLREAMSSTATKRPLRFLVVCPLSVLATWVSEAARFVPSLPTIRIHGTSLARDAAKRRLRGSLNGDPAEREYGLVITSYETFKAEASWFKNLTRWTYTILDEGHRIKNEGAQLSLALQNIRSDYRLILTGTPLQNNLLELWSLLHWLLPDIFVEGTEQLFKQSFDLSKGSIDTLRIDQAANLLQLLMIRRTKKDVDLRLPLRNEIALFPPLTELQRNVYRTLITNAQDLMQICNEDTAEGSLASTLSKQQGRTLWQRLSNLLLQLRQTSIHPYLIGGVQPDPYQLGEHVVLTSTKFVILRQLVLEKVVREKKKLITLTLDQR